MTGLEIENDTYVKKNGTFQRILLVIILLVTLFIIYEFLVGLDEVRAGKMDQLIILLTTFLGLFIVIEGFFIAIYLYFANGFEYEKGANVITTYSDILGIKISKKRKNLRNYKDIEVENRDGEKVIVLVPKNEYGHKEPLETVSTKDYTEGLWKELVEEIRKGIKEE